MPSNMAVSGALLVCSSWVNGSLRAITKGVGGVKPTQGSVVKELKVLKCKSCGKEYSFVQ